MSAIIRQAIETKYLPATDYKGSRIKATCDRGSLTVSFNHDLDANENHIAAAKALVAQFIAEDAEKYGSNADKNPRAKPFLSGGLKNTVCHVFTA
jgi:hypothetical protein